MEPQDNPEDFIDKRKESGKLNLQKGREKRRQMLKEKQERLLQEKIEAEKRKQEELRRKQEQAEESDSDEYEEIVFKPSVRGIRKKQKGETNAEYNEELKKSI